MDAGTRSADVRPRHRGVVAERAAHRRDAVAAGIGAAVGLAWATSLRGWMAHLALGFGGWPRYTWEGTFLAVLLPAVLVGALIGLDWQRRRDSRSGVPLIVWSPLLLMAGPALVADDFVATLVATGEGSGAMAVVAIGMCGGWALSGRGPVWGRAISGLVAVVASGVMASMLAFKGQGGPVSAMFGGLHVGILMVWLAFGCSLPLRPHAMRSRTS